MKYLLPFCIFIALGFTSCQKEYSDELGGTNGGGGTGGGTTASACKDCIYFPTCEGSVFTYKDSTTGSVNTTTDTMHFVKDSIINGLTFRKLFNSSNPQQSYFINCTAGVVKNITYNPTSQGGTTIAKLEITLLKYLAPVGTQWTDTLTVQGQQILYKNTLTEKNISYTVAGVNYPDVMHVKNQTGQNIPGLGFTALVTTDYYFAKGVGLVESISINNFTGDLALRHSLQSYFIP